MTTHASTTRTRRTSSRPASSGIATAPKRSPKRGPTTVNGSGTISTVPAAVTADDIAREAYFIWLERGGNEVVNWLEAERRLTDRHGR